MTDNSPIKLVPIAEKSREGVHKVYNNFAPVLENERVTAVGMFAVTSDGFVFTAFEMGENRSLFLGAMERVKNRALKVIEAADLEDEK